MPCLTPSVRSLKFLLDKIMLTLIRKIVYHLVAVALSAWQQELVNRLEFKDLKRKEVKNEETQRIAEKGK